MKKVKNKSLKKINQKRLVKMFKDIKRLKSDDNRFCFLIGAGASKSSGISTGWELAEKWYNDLKEDLDKDELAKWEKEIGFDIKRIGEFYPFLYSKRYEISPQVGYDEFKKMMGQISPGLGYVILSQILANEKHNFVITTNFDYLIEDAVRMYTSTKPFSAGHETLAEFISSQTERPTIIKVHRDLFLHPFSDDEKTQELKVEWKKALLPILKNFNLLVIGYGGNDGSLMDYLNDINSNDRKPIYWCVRDENNLNVKINSLLTEKDYIVSIDGFDELMYALNSVLGYKTFDNLDDTENHQFVQAAKKRLLTLDEKRKKLLGNLPKDKRVVISKDTKNIFTGSSKYLLDAYQERDENKQDEIYRKGLEKYPDDASLSGDYALFLSDTRKDYDKAGEYFKKAIELDPNNAIQISNYALFLSDTRKDYDKAEEYYKKAIELDPKYANMIGNYAVFLSDIRKDYDKAEEYFKKAIELDPKSALRISNYALFLSDTRKDYDKAEEYYKKAIELDPKYATQISHYALFLSDIRKDYDKAEEYYKKANELMPDDANILSNYVHHLILSKQDFKNAEILINKAFKLKTDRLDVPAELWFYRYAHYKKYQEQAEKELEKLIAKTAKSIDWNFQGHIKIAEKNGHPNIKRLQEFADALTK